MNNITKLIAIVSCACAVLTACSYNSERQKASMEKFQGNTQETIGNMTGDNELKAKGKKNRLKGDLRSTKEDIKSSVTGN